MSSTAIFIPTLAPLPDSFNALSTTSGGLILAEILSLVSSSPNLSSNHNIIEEPEPFAECSFANFRTGALRGTYFSRGSGRCGMNICILTFRPTIGRVMARPSSTISKA